MKGASLVTCEHATKHIPPELQAVFSKHQSIVRSHRGSDFGALETAQELAQSLGVRPLVGEVSRLVVDLNRSVGHPRLCAPWVRDLGSLEVERLLANYYLPHRRRVDESVRLHAAAKKRTYHLGVHSFTPRLGGHERLCDIGILFDPKRPFEAQLARRVKNCFQQHAPNLHIRFNYPYLGISDGLTTALRLKHMAQSYVGLELEINQALVGTSSRKWGVTRRLIVRSLSEAFTQQNQCEGEIEAT